MKKLLVILTILILVFSSTVLSYGNSNLSITEESVGTGVVGVYVNDSSIQSRLRLLVEKDGVRYTYNLSNEDSIQQFPLQLGNGTYTVRIMQNTTGNSYRTISSKNIELKLDNSNKVFTNSIQEIKWDETMKAIIKAKELTAGIKDDAGKVEAIYNYIVRNIKYDHAKVSTLTPLYLPNIDETLKSGQGICYDYSSLFAAMLRSVGVPTKLVKGYTSALPNEYHAWNEVLINGQWRVVDTTFDAVYVQANRKISRFKDSKTYSGERFF